jgi:hypothetical protein
VIGIESQAGIRLDVFLHFNAVIVGFFEVLKWV